MLRLVALVLLRKIRYRSVRFTHSKRCRISEHSELSVSEFCNAKTNEVRRSKTTFYVVYIFFEYELIKSSNVGNGKNTILLSFFIICLASSNLYRLYLSK